MRRPLDHLFPSASLLDILALLTQNPTREFYQRELADLSGHSLLQVQRSLERLGKAGLVLTQRRGRQVFLRANSEHPAFEEFRRITWKTVGLGDRLREAVGEFNSALRLAFIFGSVAAGTERMGSDVDVLCVGSALDRELAPLFTEVGRKLGREVNAFVMTEEQFSAKCQEKSHFMERVLSGPRIWLIGNEHELDTLVG